MSSVAVDGVPSMTINPERLLQVAATAAALDPGASTDLVSRCFSGAQQQYGALDHERYRDVCFARRLEDDADISEIERDWTSTLAGPGAVYDAYELLLDALDPAAFARRTSVDAAGDDDVPF